MLVFILAANLEFCLVFSQPHPVLFNQVLVNYKSSILVSGFVQENSFLFVYF